MASAGVGSNPARENMKELRRFQELFSGRFDPKQAVVIMERFKYDAAAATNFVMTATDAEVTQLIKDEKASADLVNMVQDLRLSGSLVEAARLGKITSTMRLFACAKCDVSWWRECPERKQVSTCRRCFVRYDPVPRDKEWGWAQFECPCGHKFSGFCEMINTSPCYKCDSEVAPFCIRPPLRRRGTRRSANAHRCDAPNCSGECSHAEGSGRRVSQAGSRGRGRRAPRGGRAVGDLRGTDNGDAKDYDRSQGNSAEEGHDAQTPPQVTCVHPSTRRAQNSRMVVFPSQPHDSTGSTVDTFLTQADYDLGSRAGSPMPPINEH